MSTPHLTTTEKLLFLFFCAKIIAFLILWRRMVAKGEIEEDDPTIW